MGCSPFPAARRSRLPLAGVVASAHVTALYPPCGPYPRCEVSAVAAGSVREAGPKRRAHPLLLQSRPPAQWGLRRQSYLLRRRYLPPRAAANRGLPLQPLAWRSWRSPLMRSTYQLFCAALGADGGASGGWSTSNGPSGAALSVAPASCGSANFACRGVGCCCVGAAMVLRPCALIEAVASRLWKAERTRRPAHERTQCVTPSVSLSAADEIAHREAARRAKARLRRRWLSALGQRMKYPL
jgi:hypothetical protein